MERKNDIGSHATKNRDEKAVISDSGKYFRELYIYIKKVQKLTITRKN